MYLARLFLGLPDTVTASFGHVTGRAVDDNAVVVLRRAGGALGVVEAGFVNRYSPFTVEIHGTDGSLFYGTPESRLLVRSSRLEHGDRWIAHDNLPADGPMAFEQWVSHIANGTKSGENIAAAVDLTRLMEAATLSAAREQPVRLDALAP